MRVTWWSCLGGCMGAQPGSMLPPCLPACLALGGWGAFACAVGSSARGPSDARDKSVVFGAGAHPHHGSSPHEGATRFTSKPFTITIDKQDGRRFSGTFSSERSTETVVGVVSRSGTIFMVDDDGHNVGTLLALNRLEMCYLHLSAASRVASCTEFTKQ